ncbi:unknown [Firmicutes bacterium CAG:124]|nr:unknown [Firmicutes bacterium CAG:124]
MQKRWISLLLVLALVLAVWSVCAVAADAQKADEAAGEEAAAEPAAGGPAQEVPQRNPPKRILRRRNPPLPPKKRIPLPRRKKHPRRTANRTTSTPQTARTAAKSRPLRR